MRRIHVTAPAADPAHPGPLERRGGMDSPGRPQAGPGLREPYEPARRGPGPPLPRRQQRDRDPVSLRLDAVRQQGRAARRQPLRHDLRRQRTASGARRGRAVEGRPGDLVHSVVMDGRSVIERCDVLAGCTEEPGRITRPFASDAMRHAHQYVQEWMRQAGMKARRDNIGNLRGELLGYCEVHIEQGPVLEARALPVGVVGGIAGQSRILIEFTGMAGHAGTVPMDRRRDALTAAAELVLAAEAAGATQPGLVATVGRLEVEPGAANVIPGRTTLSLDVRHADDGVRLEVCEALLSRTRELAKRRKLGVEIRPVSENAALRCGPRIVSLLTEAVRDSKQQPFELTSGAGHDAVAMSSLTDVGMLFVRCKGGVSHNPAESVTASDVSISTDVVGRFLELMAER